MAGYPAKLLSGSSLIWIDQDDKLSNTEEDSEHLTDNKMDEDDKSESPDNQDRGSNEG